MNIYGMKNVRIKETSNRTLVVIADTKRFGNDEIMFESFKFEDILNYLRDNDIPTDDVRFDAQSLIKKIIHRSFCTDTFEIEYPCCMIQHKYSRNELTNAEREFINSHKGIESWIKNGGLRMEYVA